jgi:pimeloyl-ACP methyl ester carboxylesterase
MSRLAPAFEPLSFTARDGLRLYARRYGARTDHRRPVLCLPGLTRNSRDFHVIASALAAEGRAVYTLDSRGRGQSDHDSDWKNYTVPNEAQDVLDFTVAHDLAGTAILGTSRGGLVAMVIAAARPTVLGPVILNDIGPVIEETGLTRIAGYVGRTPVPATWDEAAAAIARFWRPTFPAVPDTHWTDVARQLFNEADGRPAAAYDPKLAEAVAAAGTKIPPLWAQFEALGPVPVLVLRGETSDILSAATAAEMTRRHPSCMLHTVAGQGHATLLMDEPSIAVVSAFLARTEAAAH